MAKLDYYTGALKCAIKKDLKENPELIEKLGRFKERFIKWCANERIIYEADINDEVQVFIEKYINTRLYNIDVKLWKQISKEIMERDNYTCQYCNIVGGKLEIDHIIPISKGGTNELINLTTACRTCNRQKHDKTPEEFKTWKMERR